MKIDEEEQTQDIILKNIDEEKREWESLGIMLFTSMSIQKYESYL